jgi:hypothetical protein
MNDRLSSLTEADRAAFKASQKDERARSRAPREARSGEPANNQAERPTKRTKAKRVPHEGWQVCCIVDDRAAVFRVKRLEGATACDP